MAKVVKLGGKICMSKTAVPNHGLFCGLSRYRKQSLRHLGKERQRKVNKELSSKQPPVRRIYERSNE